MELIILILGNMVIMKKLSVFMPCYNVENYIADTIESVLTQTFRDFELIIVDDGSKDGTVSVVENYEIGRAHV